MGPDTIDEFGELRVDGGAGPGDAEGGDDVDERGCAGGEFLHGGIGGGGGDEGDVAETVDLCEFQFQFKRRKSIYSQ